MWYGVETVFVDGKLFDTYYGGVCYAGNEEEPMNSCKRECKNRIEIHQDWFENENLAKDFCSGKITYVHHYVARYKKSIRSTLKEFVRREIVPVDEEKGILPHRGIYMVHEEKE